MDIVQLRYKGASTRDLLDLGQEIKPILRAKKVPFIINDRVDVALALDADGVHLGQEDMPINLARRILGPDKIIGLSTHSLEQARAALSEELDYFAVGPIFPTTTKQVSAIGIKVLEELSAELAQENCIPWLAIGGINQGNLAEVIKAGAKRIAVVSAIADAADVVEASRLLKSKL